MQTESYGRSNLSPLSNFPAVIVQEIHEALNEAQLEMRDRVKAAHGGKDLSYYWGAFVLVGADPRTDNDLESATSQYVGVAEVDSLMNEVR